MEQYLDGKVFGCFLTVPIVPKVGKMVRATSKGDESEVKEETPSHMINPRYKLR